MPSRQLRQSRLPIIEQMSIVISGIENRKAMAKRKSLAMKTRNAVIGVLVMPLIGAGCQAFQSQLVQSRSWKLDDRSVVEVRCEKHSDFLKPKSERTRVRSVIRIVSSDGSESEAECVVSSFNMDCPVDLNSISVYSDADRRAV